ncbi:MAG: hypothetical protein KDK36_16785, partial [Leptospiraceae bacterium]|nr:hypothetical protein [Leptospiraceae bacterium]
MSKISGILQSYPSANIVREVNIIRKARSCNRTCQNNYANDPDVEIICGCENEIEFCSVRTNQSGNDVESCFSCPSGQNIIFQDNI